MDELARDYADSVHWRFIYNREPHPDDYLIPGRIEASNRSFSTPET